MRLSLLGGVLLVSGYLVACNLALGIEAADETVERLSSSSGGPVGCVGDGDCNDDNACTADSCSDGTCSNTPVDGESPEQVQGDCQRISCSAGSLTETPDNNDLPDDGLECTEDVCNNGVPDHPPLSAGTNCPDTNLMKCDGSGNCVECVSNQDCTLPETCAGGGTAGVCGCTGTATCASAGLSCGDLLDDGCGRMIDCDDNIANGDETDTDCGGPTVMFGGTCDVRCVTGQACTQNLDCASNSCVALMCS